MMPDYTEIPALRELVLEESYVLHVEATPGLLRVSMDLALTEHHAEYAAPSSNEFQCYRRGAVEFGGVTRLVWEGHGIRPSRDASGEVDYGNLDALRFDGDEYELESNAGFIKLKASSVNVQLMEP